MGYYNLRGVSGLMTVWEKKSKGLIPAALKTKPVSALIGSFINTDWELTEPEWLPPGIDDKDTPRSMAAFHVVNAGLAPTTTGRFRYWLTKPSWSKEEQDEATSTRNNFIYYKLIENLLGPVAREELRHVYEENQLAWQTPPDFQSRAIKRLRDEGYVLIDPKHCEYLVGLDRINECAAELTELEDKAG